jgi:pyrimidine oxygenase
MRLWPEDDHFGKRYDYGTKYITVVPKYVTVVKELWETGHSDFKGAHFQMDLYKLSPPPVAATAAGVTGVMLTFDDFIEGMDKFGELIQPRMTTRRQVAVTA